MYEMYDRLPVRISRKGFRFTFREKDSIWFDVCFRKEDGEKTIEFYVTTTELWAEKFKDILEHYIEADVEPLEEGEEIPYVPFDNTSVHEVSLAKHDIFALHTDQREQLTPISSILTANDDIVEDGDYARLSVSAETFNRKEWSKRALYAHERLMKGKIPKRAGMSSDKIVNGLSVVIMYVFDTLFSACESAIEAVQNVFFDVDSKSREDDKTDAYTAKNALINEINTSKLSAKTNNKSTQPVWRTRIRIASHTKEKLRSDLIGNTIGSAYSELAGDNDFITVKINGKKAKRVINEMNTHIISAKTKREPDVNLLSPEEISKVSLQLPTAQVQERYEEELTSNKKVNVSTPELFRNENGLLIGHSEERGEELPIYLPLKNTNEFYRGYGFVGEMGMGKDTALQNFIVEGSLNHGIGFVVIDQVNKEGREGMANGIRDSLPADKIVDLDFSDPDFIPPLDLTEVLRKLGRKGADRFASELIDFFDVADMAQTKSLLRTAAKASKGSLLETKRILEDDDYRLQLADDLAESDPIVSYELARQGEKIARNKVDPILSRLDDFFGDSTLNAVFSQPPKPDLDFERFMREGKVVICRVPDRHLSTVSTRTLVHWLTLKTLMTRLLMDADGQENGAFVVYNEPQTYLNDGLARLISRVATQGRKERLGALIAVQYFDQLGALQDDLLGGGINWILFRNGSEKLYERLKTRLEPHVTTEEAMRTEKFHAINSHNFGGNVQRPFLVRMLSPCYERYQAYDNEFLTRRHARMYGRSMAEIEARIVKRLRAEGSE